MAGVEFKPVDLTARAKQKRRVLQDALALSEQERAEIAARLIESLDAGPLSEAAEVAAAWAAEIERRCAALDARTTGTTNWDELRRQIKLKSYASEQTRPR